MKKINLLLTIAFISVLNYTTVFSMDASEQTIYAGIDVSDWQGSIDYSKVKADGIEVVYIKSSEGSDFLSMPVESKKWYLIDKIF